MMLSHHEGQWFSHATLSLRTQLSHQQVFQICRDLSRKGRVRREREGREWWVCYGEPRRGIPTLAAHDVIVFDWISDERLRGIVRSDWEDSLRSLNTGIWKGAVVLGGACLEGVLIGAIQKDEADARKLLSDEYRANSISSIPLRQLCRVAQRMGLIGSRVSDFLIKSRNLVHPGASLEEGGPLSKGDAEAAVRLLSDCIGRIEKSLLEDRPQGPS